MTHEVDAYTVEVGGCGCSVDLHKTCACPKAAQVDVVQCPMHKAAPDLLAALKQGQLVTTSFNGMLSHKIPDEEIIGALDSLLDSFAAAADAAIAKAEEGS